MVRDTLVKGDIFLNCSLTEVPCKPHISRSTVFLERHGANHTHLQLCSLRGTVEPRRYVTMCEEDVAVEVVEAVLIILPVEEIVHFCYSGDIPEQQAMCMCARAHVCCGV